ncbi:hypothetical protein SteCoe_12764 [Stentor coeruleus]|uniref:Uncharacterized protein n=1 Tax=Stentor coeruleus TaxID=5963 RepID=A0A1R2CA58_9CILI|nr:hypothetical protein SteCoe_12764 [Stentor coeruleus]
MPDKTVLSTGIKNLKPIFSNFILARVDRYNKMKGFKKNLSVKVSEKKKFTENHIEFVRVKRKVIRRISRKITVPENLLVETGKKPSLVQIFKSFVVNTVEKYHKKLEPESFFTKAAKNGHGDEPRLEEVSDNAQQADEPVILTVSDESDQEISQDLNMPLQF